MNGMEIPPQLEDADEEPKHSIKDLSLLWIELDFIQDVETSS